MEDEIFGPILPILTYKTFDEAIVTDGGDPRALAGFIFSRDPKTIDRFIGELSFGGGGVNLVNVSLVRRDHAVRWLSGSSRDRGTTMENASATTR